MLGENGKFTKTGQIFTLFSERKKTINSLKWGKVMAAFRNWGRLPGGGMNRENRTRVTWSRRHPLCLPKSFNEPTATTKFFCITISSLSSAVSGLFICLVNDLCPIPFILEPLLLSLFFSHLLSLLYVLAIFSLQSLCHLNLPHPTLFFTFILPIVSWCCLDFRLALILAFLFSPLLFLHKFWVCALNGNQENH